MHKYFAAHDKLQLVFITIWDLRNTDPSEKVISILIWSNIPFQMIAFVPNGHFI